MSIFSDDLSNDLDHVKKIKNILRLTSVILAVLLITSSVFLVRYYLIANQTSQTVKAKEEKSAKLAAAKKEAEVKKIYEKKIAEEKANPWQTYKTEDIFGVIKVVFPKSWKTTIKKDLANQQQLNFWADPNYVTYNVNSKENYAAFRMSVINRKYEDLAAEYEGKKRAKKYEISDTTLAGIAGKKINWKNTDIDKNVSLTIIPYRDKVLFVGTDDLDQFSKDYEQILKKIVLNK